MIQTLDHVNIRTARLAEMVAWYGDVLGLMPGARPDFPFGGAWLYAGDQPIIHLIDAADAPPGGGNLALEHAAFRATGLKQFLGKLDARGVEYSIGGADYLPVIPVNIWDPDGNHLHVDFDRSEADD